MKPARIPASVQRGGDEADELQRRLIAASGGAPMTGGTEAHGDPGRSAANEIVNGGQGASAQHQPGSQDAQPIEDAAYWKARFTGLKQIHDSTVHDLRQRLSAALADRTEAPSQAAASESPAAKPPGSTQLTADDIAYVGEEGIEAMRKIAAEAAASATAPIRQESESARALKHQQYMSSLESLVPDFRVTNGRDDWKRWLGQLDPLTGYTRQVGLDAANAAFDAAGVASYFRGFAQASNPAAAQQQQPIDVQPAAVRAAAGSADDSGMVEMWDQSEVDTFLERQAIFERKALQTGHRDPEQAKELRETEQRIFKAMNEGRIDPAR